MSKLTSTAPNTAPLERSRDEAIPMFDRIAERYDVANRVLSFGMDTGWRRAVRRLLPARNDLALLDVATGTGDLMLSLAKDPRVTSALGVDLAVKMLEHAERKIGERKARASDAKKTLAIEVGDALKLEKYEGQYDVVTIAFGIRNVLDVDLAVQQMAACLKPGGRLMIMEFGTPRSALVRPMYEGYRRHVLPRVGGLVSGDKDAYQYLDETIATFTYGEAMMEKLRRAGLIDVNEHLLTLGVVSLYVGDKPMADAKETAGAPA